MNVRRNLSIALLMVSAYIAMTNMVLLCLSTNHLTVTEIFLYKVTLIAMNIFLLVSLICRISIEPAIATPSYHFFVLTMVGFSLWALLLVACVAYHIWYGYLWGQADAEVANSTEARNLRHCAYTTYVLCLIVFVIGILALDEIRWLNKATQSAAQDQQRRL